MKKGMFSQYGGQFAPEAMMHAINELEEAYLYYKDDPDFCRELN